MILLLLSFGVVTVVAFPAPGLLRVPRVYNALVTSNQNLSPSRAFPVIQPVVHTTAVGYVPPFYYTEFAPHYPGPETGRVDQELLPVDDAAKVTANKDPAESSSPIGGIVRSPDSETQAKEVNSNSGDENPHEMKENPHDLDSLSFYPNYQSLFLDPYTYTYNGFSAHVTSNPYLFHYQPQALPPLPPQASNSYQGHQLLPHHAEITRNGKKNYETEKVPDVPPPPVPTPSSKRSQG